MNKAQLLTELKKAIDKSDWPITKKTGLLPVRVVLPKVLEKMQQSFQVTARTFWGGKLKVMLPEIVSTHLYRFGYFDREVCFYLVDSLSEGGTYIDIGAHFGSFSLLGSTLVGKSGKVIAVDPTPSTFKLLSSNLGSYAPWSNYKLHNIALYDKPGKTPFFDFGLSKSAYNSILGSRDSSMKNTDNFKIEVETDTLDNLVAKEKLQRIDFIKIDAESAELAILKGGQETLKKFSPRITVEIGDTGLSNAPKSIEVISFLQQLGYDPFEVRDGKLVPHALLNNYQKDALTCYNLLFIKK
jgi:FkbM family methyltransferase